MDQMPTGHSLVPLAPPLLHRAGPRPKQRHPRQLPPGAPTTSRSKDCFVSKGEHLILELFATTQGLLVQRQQWSGAEPATHMKSVTLIRSGDEFSGWLDAEPLRFKDPLLHRLLRRRGEELLRGRQT